MNIPQHPSFQPIKRPGSAHGGPPFLDPGGPAAILGWDAADFALSIAPSERRLFGPRGACLHPDGSLWVSDTGHHRLLGWRTVPTRDNTPADLLIGQPDFTREGRNAKGPVTAATLNVPTGIAAWGAGLAVADAWNHRVLLWRTVPTRTNQPADIILGQVDASGSLANHGAEKPTAATLHWPYGVAVLDGRLYVADTGNRRVLIWDNPQQTGQPADLVLGQESFTCRDENAGRPVGAGGMRWPHGLALWQGHLAVSDAGNNRVMLWHTVPATSGAPADMILGQQDAVACDHNQAGYYPLDASLNMPYGIATCGAALIVADTANSRLVSWDDAATGAPARWLNGQPDFAAKGDNRWGLAERDSLCWPYGLSALGDLAAIADSGNNRILLWRRAS